MAFAHIQSAFAAAVLSLGSLAAHADTSVQTGKPELVATYAAPVPGAVLTELHSPFVDGDHIGTVRAGSACEATRDRDWSPLVQQRIEAELTSAFSEELSRAADLRFAAAGRSQPVRMQAFLNNIDMQLCQAAAGAWQGSIYVQVSWQVVSPVTGQVVYQASTEGSFTLAQPERIATASGLHGAFGVAVRKLLDDRRFTAMLQTGDTHRVASAY